MLQIRSAAAKNPPPTSGPVNQYAQATTERISPVRQIRLLDKSTACAARGAVSDTAAAVRVPWINVMDATIFVVGSARSFGSGDRPRQRTPKSTCSSSPSLAYLGSTAFCCSRWAYWSPGAASRRPGIPLLLSGFATCFSATSSGPRQGAWYYLPGGFQDVLYLSCYDAVAAGAHRCVQLWCRACSVECQTLWRVRPYAAMLAAFLVLVYFARGDIAGDDRDDHDRVCTHAAVHGPAGCGFAGDALLRERRAARMVEDDTHR